MIALLFVLAACASTPEVIPDLPMRTLELAPDKPAFVYFYPVCSKTFLGKCTKYDMHEDVYDLTDQNIRNKLIDTGFVATVREKIQP